MLSGPDLVLDREEESARLIDANHIDQMMLSEYKAVPEIGQDHLAEGHRSRLGTHPPLRTSTTNWLKNSVPRPWVSFGSRRNAREVGMALLGAGVSDGFENIEAAEPGLNLADAIGIEQQGLHGRHKVPMLRIRFGQIVHSGTILAPLSRLPCAPKRAIHAFGILSALTIVPVAVGFATKRPAVS